MIIAFSGPDGSGKSTLLNEVKRELEANGVSVVIHNEFQFVYLSFINRFAKGSAAKSYKDNAILKKQLPSFGQRIIGFSYGIAVCVELFIEYLSYEIFKRKKVLLRDRYALDFKISNIAMGGSKLASALLGMFPAPSLHFVLSVPSRLTAKRIRQTRDFSFTSEYYDNLAGLYEDHLPKKAIIIDNSSIESKKQIRRYALTKVKFINIREVAISGLDGAGKSTTVAELSELLQKLHIPHTSRHFYYEYILLKLLPKSKKSSELSEDQRNEASRKAEEKHVLNGKSKVWVIFVLTDAFIQYALVKLFRRGRVIIFDRFFPDYLISFDFLKAPYDRRFLRKIFPSPDRYFLQIADYKVLYARKPEHSLQFFKECYEKYVTLAKENDMVLLDSTKQDKSVILSRLVENL